MATPKTRKKAPKKRKKMGRPSPYTEEYCDQASRACMLGAINDDLAKKFGVSVTTIKRWMNKYPDFRAAIKKGRETADEDVAISLYKRATGYSHPDVHISNYQGVITITKLTKHYAPDTGAAAMWLKNRRPDRWRDKPEGDEIGEALPVSVTIEVKDASKKETG